MKDVLDTHTHTVVSGHAYSSMQEMIRAASDAQLELLCITEHGPKMMGSTNKLYFHNYRVVPREIYGVKLMLGVELNIMDYEGTIDLPTHILEDQDIVIASLHPPCIKMGSREENTSALINAIKNPYIHIVGHPDDARYPIDQEAVIQAAKEYNKIIELNNNSLAPNSFREGAEENNRINLKLCMKYNVPVAMGSDAHISFDVGNHNYAKKLIEKVGFNEELLLNTSVKGFQEAVEKINKNRNN